MRRLDEHLEKLLPFATIAELGSLHRAAERLHTSQPALTQMLKTMEGQLGVALFARTSRGMVLTDDGETLYRFAKSILKQTAELRFGLEPEYPALRLATYESIADLIAPHLGAFPQAERCQITCQVSGLKLIDLLTAGETDFVVLADPPKVRGITFEKIIDSRYGIFATKEYLANRSRSRAESMQWEPLIYVPGSVSSSTGIIDRFVANAGLGQGKRITVNSYVVAKTLTLAHQGLGVLVDVLVAREVRAKELREVHMSGTTQPVTSVYLGYREGQNARSQYRGVRRAVSAAFA